MERRRAGRCGRCVCRHRLRLRCRGCGLAIRPSERQGVSRLSDGASRDHRRHDEQAAGATGLCRRTCAPEVCRPAGHEGFLRPAACLCHRSRQCKNNAGRILRLQLPLLPLLGSRVDEILQGAQKHRPHRLYRVSERDRNRRSPRARHSRHASKAANISRFISR